MVALAEFVVVGDEVLAEVAAELHGFGFGFVEMLIDYDFIYVFRFN